MLVYFAKKELKDSALTLQNKPNYTHNMKNIIALIVLIILQATAKAYELIPDSGEEYLPREIQEGIMYFDRMVVILVAIPLFGIPIAMGIIELTLWVQKKRLKKIGQ